MTWQVVSGDLLHEFSDDIMTSCYDVHEHFVPGEPSVDGFLMTLTRIRGPWRVLNDLVVF